MSLPLTIDHLLWRMENVHRHAELTVVTPSGGAVRRSFGEIAARARALAAGLRETFQLERGSVVAVLAFNNDEHLELLLAVPTLGAAVESINVRARAELIRAQLRESGPGVVLVDQEALDHPLVGHTIREVLDSTRGSGVKSVVFDSRTDSGLDQLRAVGQASLLEPLLPAETDVAFLFHSSGTTGQPKTFRVTHRDAVLHALSQATTVAADLRPTDRVLPLAPFFHVNGWGLPLTCAITGSDLVLTGSDVRPATVLDVLAKERITVAAGVPTVWHDVCNVARERAAAHGTDEAPSQLWLRQVMTGGSLVPPSVAAAVLRWLGAPIVNAWGMTETMACSTYERVDPADAAGLPIPLVEIRITDHIGDQSGGRRGRLQVRAAFVVDAAPATRDGWMDTGDVASLTADGRLRLHDRQNDLIKSGGEWIASAELEQRLCTHPGIATAAVVAQPDARWSERPIAYVVLTPGLAADDIDVEELRAHLAEVFPKWWLPDAITIVPELPRTTVGKIDKVSLRLAADTNTGVLQPQPNRRIDNNEVRP